MCTLVTTTSSPPYLHPSLPCVCWHCWQCLSFKPAEFPPAGSHPNSYFAVQDRKAQQLFLGVRRPLRLFLSPTKAESTNGPETPMSKADVRTWLGFIRILGHLESVGHLSSHSFDSRWWAREQQRIPQSLSFSFFLEGLLCCSLTYSRGYRYLSSWGGLEATQVLAL